MLGKISALANDKSGYFLKGTNVDQNLFGGPLGNKNCICLISTMSALIYVMPIASLYT